jgi:acid phosphatase type 7
MVHNLRLIGSAGLAMVIAIGALSCAEAPALIGPGGNEPPPGNDPGGSAILVGAGDIARCSTPGAAVTAALLDGIAGTVFAAGDNAYENGTAAEYTSCYEPTWGRHKVRTRPTPGNHEYNTPGATPYYAYFGESAGPAGRGYYSYDLGAWHAISLNSNVAADAASAQMQWLRADLAANETKCAVAYWHHPVFSSGDHGNNPKMAEIWRVLDSAGVDVVLVGHDHNYERFAPQTYQGVADPNGIRSFVVGTGGTAFRSFSTIRANSEVRDTGTWGVLKLTLRPTSYSWEFVHEPGKTFTDTGLAACVD